MRPTLTVSYHLALFCVCCVVDDGCVFGGSGSASAIDVGSRSGGGGGSASGIDVGSRSGGGGGSASAVDVGPRSDRERQPPKCTNAATNVTLQCERRPVDSENLSLSSRGGVIWILPQKKSLKEVSSTGELELVALNHDDTGTYECLDAESNQSIRVFHLRVCTVPKRVVNLSVLPHSVFAMVTWSTPDDGGADIQRYVLSVRQRRTDDEADGEPKWHVFDIPGNDNVKTVYNLRPNTTYYFRLFAVNSVGSGNNTDVLSQTQYDLREIEAANQLLGQSASMLKIWVVALTIILVTFAILGLGISLLLLRNWGRSRSEVNIETREEEAMELVAHDGGPNITLNPSFNIDMLEYIEADAASTADALSVGGLRTNLVSPSEDVKPNG